MAKGTYAVGEGGETSARDASYKSCLCALLIFIAICVIIVLAGIRWTKDEIKKDVEDEIELLGLKGDHLKTTSPYEKLVSESPTRGTTLRTIIIHKVYTPLKPPTTTKARTTTTTTTTPTTTTVHTTTTTTPTTTTVRTTTTTAPTTTTPRTTLPSYTTASTAKTLKSVSSNPRENEVEKEISLTTANTTTTTTVRTPLHTVPYIVPEVIEIENSTATTEATTTNSNVIIKTGVSIHDDKNTSTETTTAERTTESRVNKTSREKTTESHVNKTSTDKTTESYINKTSTATTVAEKTTENPINKAINNAEITTDSTTETITETAETIIGKETTEYVLLLKLTQSYKEKEVLKELGTITEESSTTTEVDESEVILVKNTMENSTAKQPIRIVATPETTTLSETTTETKGQQVMIRNYDDYFNFDNESAEIITKVQKTTKAIEITTKMQSRHEGMNTTTEMSPLLRKSEPVCLSVECKSAASRMLSLMNHSVDPCEDFYEFACGGMRADNADSDTWKRLSEQLHLINNKSPQYLQKFKEFYDSCVTHEYEFDYQQRTSRVLNLVKQVGEIFDNEPPASSYDMTELFAKLILRQSLPIMDVGVDIDKQSSKFILKLTLPKKTSILKESGRWSALSEGQKRCLDDQRDELQQPNLDLNKIHDSYLTCQKNYTIYLNSIQTVVRALGFYSHLTDTYNRTQQIQDLRTTIEWDILEYLNNLPPPNEIRKATLLKNYFIEKVSDLQVHYPFLEWKKLFKLITGHEFESNTLIQVYFRDYFNELFQGLSKHRYKWKINNALVAMYAHELYENLVIPQARHKRETYCIKLSSKLFHDISSNIYMKTWSKTEMEDSQKFLTKIFDSLKGNLKTTLQKVEWLDDDSKVLISSKANKMSLTFNKQEDLYNNETYLNLKYHSLALTSDDFLYNAVKMMETERILLYGLQGKPYSINYLWSYFLNAYDDAPTSFYSKTLIMAPLGMVKQPVRGFPGYITMARIGLSLAREIGRHFDPVGIRYGMTLTPGSQHSYDSMEKNMESDELLHVKRAVGQQEVSFQADSKLSANERIADNTGLRLISDVFNRTDFLLPWISTAFSRGKIFYISVAQEYCKQTDMTEYMQQLFETEELPASLRVENIMSNSDDFSEVFECREGSAMNNNPLKTQFPYLQKEEDYSYEDLANIS